MYTWSFAQNIVAFTPLLRQVCIMQLMWCVHMRSLGWGSYHRELFGWVLVLAGHGSDGSALRARTKYRVLF